MTPNRYRVPPSPRCVGCNAIAHYWCPVCHKPTCRRAVGLCGNAAACAACVQRLLAASQDPKHEEMT